MAATDGASMWRVRGAPRPRPTVTADGGGTAKPDPSAEGLLLVAQEKADVARHREIICKAVAGILVLLLKHLKLVRR